MSTGEQISTLRELHTMMLHHPVNDPEHIAEDVNGNEVIEIHAPEAVCWCFMGGLLTIGGGYLYELEQLLREQPAHAGSFTETFASGNAPLNIEQAIKSLGGTV